MSGSRFAFWCNIDSEAIEINISEPCAGVLDMGPERFASPAPIFWFTEAVGNECCGLQNVEQQACQVFHLNLRQPSTKRNQTLIDWPTTHSFHWKMFPVRSCHNCDLINVPWTSWLRCCSKSSFQNALSTTTSLSHDVLSVPEIWHLQLDRIFIDFPLAHGVRSFLALCCLCLLAGRGFALHPTGLVALRFEPQLYHCFHSCLGLGGCFQGDTLSSEESGRGPAWGHPLVIAVV